MTTYTPPPAPPGPPPWEPPPGQPPWEPPPAPPAPPPHKRHTGRNVAIIGAAAAILAAGVTAVAVGSSTGTGTAPQTSTSQPAPGVTNTAPQTQPPAPAPVPSPDGTYQGSGDYILSPTLYGNDYLVGEVDVTNTGNVGIVARVKFTWPQEGLPPIVAHKTVRIPYGATRTVRFHVSAGNVSNSNVIQLLQSWQEGHNFQDGYTSHVTIIDTFGAAH